MSDTDDPSKRDSLGRFKDGHPGGPGRKRMRQDVRDMLEAATPKAAQRLIEALDATKTITVWVGKDQQETEQVDDYDLRIKAANAVLDRIHGKPAQAITNDDGSPLIPGARALHERLAAIAATAPSED